MGGENPKPSRLNPISYRLSQTRHPGAFIGQIPALLRELLE